MLTWCGKISAFDIPDCGGLGCHKCGRHRRNFNQAVLGLHEEPTQLMPENFEEFFGGRVIPTTAPISDSVAEVLKENVELRQLLSEARGHLFDMPGCEVCGQIVGRIDAALKKL